MDAERVGFFDSLASTDDRIELFSEIANHVREFRNIDCEHDCVDWHASLSGGESEDDDMVLHFRCRQGTERSTTISRAELMRIAGELFGMTALNYRPSMTTDNPLRRDVYQMLQSVSGASYYNDQKMAVVKLILGRYRPSCTGGQYSSIGSGSQSKCYRNCYQTRALFEILRLKAAREVLQKQATAD